MTADLLHGLKNGDEQAYKHLFYLYYANLVVYANTFLKNGGAAEDVIQEFYNSILERKVNGIRYSLKGFWDKYTGSGVVFSENLIKAYRQAYCQAA